MEKPINKRAVIYCRVSTKEQVEEGNSLVTQEKACRDYALQNGYEVAEIFIEQGESAKTQNRPELIRLMAYCGNRKNHINAVIAYKLDRISRNTDDYSQIRIGLKVCGVEIKSTSEYFENTPAGRFMENIISNVSQFDNDVRTERSVGGLKEAMREGRYVWMAPVGYANIRVGGKSTIAPNTLAPVVLKIFEEVAKNLRPPEQIRIEMQKEILSRYGKPIVRSYFYKLLKNELYCGWILKFGERHKGLFESIISQDLFEQVQSVLKHGRKFKGIYRIENPDFPLRRFIKNTTGKKITGGWAKGRNNKYPYYWFVGDGYQIGKDILEEKFQKMMNKFQFDEKHFTALKKLVNENLAKKTKNNIRKAELLKSIISELENKQSLLIERNLEGIISKSILQTQLNLADQEIMKVKSELYQIHDTKVDYEKLLEIVHDLLLNPFNVWQRAPLRIKIALQWFKFPEGLTLENNNFRTAEICRLFKEKKTFLSLLSTEVHPKEKILNTPKVVSFNRHEKSLANKEEFWNSIDEELQTVAEILSENN
jgi:DNA invertase Pin-like site-specific DNA recombinase